MWPRLNIFMQRLSASAFLSEYRCFNKSHINIAAYVDCWFGAFKLILISFTFNSNLANKILKVLNGWHSQIFVRIEC